MLNHRVGVFSTLTNSYALTAIGASENFYSVFEAELQDVIPIVRTTIAGTRIVGRLTTGYVCFAQKKTIIAPRLVRLTNNKLHETETAKGFWSRPAQPIKNCNTSATPCQTKSRSSA